MKDTLSGPRLVTVLSYAFLALLAWLVFLVFRPFLAPLGWAAVLTVVFYPIHRRLEKRLGKTHAALVSTVGATVILIVPALAVAAAFVHQGLEALRNVEAAGLAGQLGWLNRIWFWLLAHLPGQTTVHFSQVAKEEAQRLVSGLAGGIGLVVTNIALFLFDLIVTIFAMFYFFRDAEKIMDGIRAVLPLSAEHRERMIGQAQELIFAGVLSSLLAAAAHGVLGGVAFALLGIRAAVFWGVMMAFCALLPLVGAWLIWGPAVGWLLFHGRLGAGIALLIVCGLAVIVIDNVLRPMLISGRARLSGLVVFISVLGGIGVFGALGVVLGPVVVAAALSVLAAYRKGRPVEEFPGIEGSPAENSRRRVLE